MNNYEPHLQLIEQAIAETQSGPSQHELRQQLIANQLQLLAQCTTKVQDEQSRNELGRALGEYQLEKLSRCSSPISIKEQALQQLRELKKLDITPEEVVIKYTVIFNIPIDPTTNDYIIKLIQAATAVASTGLIVENSSLEFPECMIQKEDK
jgi:hypothetical protein